MLAMSLLRAGLDGSQMRLQHRCVGHHLATVMAVVMAVIASVQICSDIRWFSGSFPLLSISKPISKPIPKPILLLIITNYYRFSRKISHDHQLNLGERRSAASYVAPSPPNRLRPWKQRWPKLFQTSLPTRSDLLETRPPNVTQQGTCRDQVGMHLAGDKNAQWTICVDMSMFRQCFMSIFIYV